jgi:aryl-alcohol dehydrogenase-like predicted oxidoreductase
MASGILSGKYTRQQRAEGPVRLDSMQLQSLSPRNREIAQAVDAVADRLGVASSQVALAWVVSRGVIPIVGATKAGQMSENMRAVDLVLDAATLGELDQASAFDAGHPYSMLDFDMQIALGYGGMFDRIDIPRFPSSR